MKKQNFKNSKIVELPNNFLAEQAVLNILLTNPNLIKTVNSLINIESFYFEPHRLIYLTILELTEELNVEKINLTNIITSLQDKSRLKKIGGIERIISTISTFENFSDLEVTATTDDKEQLVMALEKSDEMIYGVQFHPESIGTPNGMSILKNFLAIGKK